MRMQDRTRLAVSTGLEIVDPSTDFDNDENRETGDCKGTTVRLPWDSETRMEDATVSSLTGDW